MKLFIRIAYIAMIITTLPACDKKGCTDLTASNFCSKCNSDDGSCKYQGNVVVWWTQATAQHWQSSYNTSSVTVYVDNVSAGTFATSTFWAVAPGCQDSGVIAYSKNIGAVQSLAGTVVVKSANTGATLKTIGFTYAGGICIPVQIQ
jgi:hypothetical protein